MNTEKICKLISSCNTLEKLALLKEALRKKHGEAYVTKYSPEFDSFERFLRISIIRA